MSAAPHSSVPGSQSPATQSTGKIIAAGVIGGFLAGLFGVGGGIVMVPLFVLWLGLDQRRAVTTSLVAIIPIAVFGIADTRPVMRSSGSSGWSSGVGSIVGALFGTWLPPASPSRLCSSLRSAAPLLRLPAGVPAGVRSADQ